MDQLTNASYTTVRGKEFLMKELKRNGCRMTNQRKLLIDIILQNECCCCKEIYYQAVKKDPSIGIATVYRMVKMLEDLGFLSRKIYQISCDRLGYLKDGEAVFLRDGHASELDTGAWYSELKAFLKSRGLIDDEEISVIIRKSGSADEREEDYCGRYCNRA